MARKPRVASPEPGFQVEQRAIVGARPMCVVGSDAPAWAMEAATFEAATIESFRMFRNAIVRIDPPESATDDFVELFRQCVVAGGAAAVKVTPRRRAAVVPVKQSAPVRAPSKSARAVVTELAAEANVDDKQSLAAFLESVMSQQGL